MSPHLQLAIRRNPSQSHNHLKNPSSAARIPTMPPKRAATSVLLDAQPCPLRTSRRLRRVATLACCPHNNARSQPADNAARTEAPKPVWLLRHLEGECLLHPVGNCTCEAVQTPSLHQNEAWGVMAQRFKAMRECRATEQLLIFERTPTAHRRLRRSSIATTTLQSTPTRSPLPSPPPESSWVSQRRPPAALQSLIAAYRKAVPISERDALRVLPLQRMSSLSARPAPTSGLSPQGTGAVARRHSLATGTAGGWAHPLRG
ncbi:hypothetical protein T484DRAFT_1928937 [Baffinella frigidus]|nr:hypothetical protein T484DRAFT_1928937 [Cryptophyta sp. CCMP2293]|eukprot:CAMPEP_0180132510 /NCGR_PEP_ID=MMETSP0986-20121125/9026_1 /TAXON_ID=697907 /ORGANISM="non described non described, Strain CCMP2293" /LENGTH=259 /DNA_ID=CAMNT_0022072527 /DNA_START=62 /DNA_END=841 /DNA_ORIENTATION=+